LVLLILLAGSLIIKYFAIDCFLWNIPIQKKEKGEFHNCLCAVHIDDVNHTIKVGLSNLPMVSGYTIGDMTLIQSVD
jgi:hypothetical protein